MTTSVGNLASTMAAELTTIAATTPTASLVPTPVEVGMSATKIISTATEVDEVVAPLVADCFTMNSSQSTDLKSQLNVYFDKAGIMNEEFFSFMTSVQS